MQEFAIELAQQAGDLLLGYLRAGLSEDQIRTKASHADLVTEADMASEQLILDAIRSRFPGHSIFAEETAQGEPPEAEWVWVIDPLDGTANFAHGLPLFAVNIAVAHHGMPVLAVTHDPCRGCTYWATAGNGAWMRAGGQKGRLHVSHTPVLSRCMLATGFPYDRATNPDNNVAEFAALDRQVHAVRRLGSSALAMAWVAAGILDGFWEARLKPWDCAAGWSLITEAGGSVTDYAGKAWHLRSQNIIACNGQPAVQRAIQDTIAAVRASLR